MAGKADKESRDYAEAWVRYADLIQKGRVADIVWGSRSEFYAENGRRIFNDIDRQRRNLIGGLGMAGGLGRDENAWEAKNDVESRMAGIMSRHSPNAGVRVPDPSKPGTLYGGRYADELVADMDRDMPKYLDRALDGRRVGRKDPSYARAFVDAARVYIAETHTTVRPESVMTSQIDDAVDRDPLRDIDARFQARTNLSSMLYASSSEDDMDARIRMQADRCADTLRRDHEAHRGGLNAVEWCRANMHITEAVNRDNGGDFTDGALRRAVSDEMWDALCGGGSPDEVCDRLAAISDVQRCYTHSEELYADRKREMTERARGMLTEAPARRTADVPEGADTVRSLADEPDV